VAGLSEKREQHAKALLHATEPLEMARLQGRIIGLDEAINLREVLLPRHRGRS